MAKYLNIEEWLLNEQPAVGTGTDTMTGIPGMGPPLSDPYGAGAAAPAGSPNADPNIANMPMGDLGQGEPQNVADDPQFPDMPEDEDDEEIDFETWKRKFIVASIQGDVEEMKNMLLSMRGRELSAYGDRFVSDNYNIILLRENANIEDASKEIRRMLKEEIDRNNPGTSLAEDITSVLERMPVLNNIFVKLSGLGAMKADQHRKFIAALTGSVMVGNGSDTEDLIFNTKDYAINISTRMNSRWGDVFLGDWSLKEDDPERYLQQVELKRLEDGSPEEKEALKHRVIIESIAQMFKTRAFYINVVETDGTIYTLGWDIATSLMAGFTEGKLVVKTTQSDNSEAMIDDDGAIIAFDDIKIVFRHETGELDEEGMPFMEEVEFMNRRRGGRLFLTATLEVIRESSTSFQGMGFKESPWQGNPSDIEVLKHCVVSSSEILLRQC